MDLRKVDSMRIATKSGFAVRAKMKRAAYSGPPVQGRQEIPLGLGRSCSTQVDRLVAAGRLEIEQEK